MLDLWFEQRFARNCRGKACWVRYADDCVACFTHEEDARRLHEERPERRGAFALAAEPSKTALRCCGRQAYAHRARLGLKRPATLDFLGFTHSVGRSHRGRFVVGRKTQAKRASQKLKAVGKSWRGGGRQGHDGLRQAALARAPRLLRCQREQPPPASLRVPVSRRLFKWLNRRSQRRHIDWVRFSRVPKSWLPPVGSPHNRVPAPW